MRLDGLINSMFRMMGRGSLDLSDAENANFLREYRSAGLKLMLGAAIVSAGVVFFFIFIDSFSQVVSSGLALLRVLMFFVITGFVVLVLVKRAFVIKNYVPVCSFALAIIFSALAAIIASPGVVSVIEGFSAAPVLLFALLLLYGFVRLPVVILLVIGFAFSGVVLDAEGDALGGASFYRTSLYGILANLMGGALAYSIYCREVALYLERCSLARARDVLFGKNTQLRVAHEEKSLLLASVGHDIRPPLLALEVQLRVLAKFVGTVNSAAASDAVSGAQNALSFVRFAMEDLLDSTKLGRNAPVSLIRVDLAGLIGGAMDVCRPFAEERGVSVRAVFSRSEQRGFTDPALLGRVIQNLLVNAIKFTPVAVGCDRSVVIALRTRADRMCIHVLDRGVGIAENEIGAIWKPFYRSAHVDGAGFGLGLYVVKQAISLLPLHSISVASKLGKGTLFSIVLPRFEQESALKAVGLSSQSEFSLEGAYVIVFDLGLNASDQLARWVEDSGALVDFVSEGGKGEELIDLAERTVDAVLVCAQSHTIQETVRNLASRLSALPAGTTVVLVTEDAAVDERLSSCRSDQYPLVALSDRGRLVDFIRAGLARNIEFERQGGVPE